MLIIIWLVYGAVLVLAPQVFTSGLALTMLTQMGYLIIICLSYNILLGQAGLLSFGHVVYVGAGAFAAVHALNQIGAGSLGLPVSLVPLAGGLAGALAAVIFGFLSTRRAGTTFAMITLGIGELVAAVALMFPVWFGGEGGITTDRVVGEPVWGISFGPNIQVYYLIALWCFGCTVLMYALTKTPLGRIFNAVRDNAQRLAFVGYDPQRVRYLAFVAAGFFAGIGGALMVLHLEMVTAADSFSHERSGAYLLFTFVGGVAAFAGPIVGAILMVLVTIGLSEWTQAWKLYLGLLFMLMVMFAPNGMTGIVARHWQFMRQRGWWRLLLPYFCLLASLLLLAGASAVLIEMVYQLQLGSITGSRFQFMGLSLDVAQWHDWLMAVAGGALALCLTLFMRRNFRRVLAQYQPTGTNRGAE